MLELVTWAKRFIATPSVSRMGNEAIAEQAIELLEELGIPARSETVVVDGVQHRAVIADIGPADRDDGLLMITHLDTVPPGDAKAWTATGGDPYSPTEEGNRLYGLGSADAKVDFVCKAHALASIDRDHLQRPIRLVGTFAEEIGLVGARWLVDQGLAEGFRYALVGEPSELQAIHAHKGYAVFEARVGAEAVCGAHSGYCQEQLFAGHSAHSSTPHLGCNAIEAALERLTLPDVTGFVSISGGGAVNKVPDHCELVACLADASAPSLRASSSEPPPPMMRAAKPLLEFHRGWRDLLEQLSELKNIGFDPNISVGSLGRVETCEGGVSFYFDLRPIPGVDPLEAVRPLEELAEVRCIRSNPALATSLNSKLVRAVACAQEQLGIGRNLGTKATCTEAGLLSANGLEAVVVGAGPSVGNVHRPNEYTRISELAQARDLYRLTIEALCSGGELRCS